MPALAGESGDGGTGRRDGAGPLQRLDHEHLALATAQPEQRRGAEQRGVALAQRRQQPLAQVERRLARGRRLLRSENDPDQVRERRIAERAAALELLGREGGGSWRAA